MRTGKKDYWIEEMGTNLVGVGPHWNTERTSETKVRKLEVIMLIDEQVLRFQITMENSMRMTIEQSRVELVQEFLQEKKP